MKHAILLVLILIFPLMKGVVMDGKTIEAGGFQVVGITVRTANKAEIGADGKIPKLWGEVFSRGIIGRIPNKADNNIIVLYYDYQSDKDGEYTYLIGARVTSAPMVPDGMVSRNVPAGKYAVFTSEQGPIAQIVQKTWKRIWDLPKDQPGGNRSYQVDYEVYESNRTHDPQNAEVDVYIGIK